MVADTVLCILLSSKPLFSALSAFSLPSNPVNSWLGVSLDDVSRMAFVVVFNSNFPLFSIFTAINVSLCIVMVFPVQLTSSSDMRMISASSTDAESLSLIIVSLFLNTTATVTRVPSLEPSVQYELLFFVENGCTQVISVSIFPFPPESCLFYIRVVIVPMFRVDCTVAVYIFFIILALTSDRGNVRSQFFI